MAPVSMAGAGSDGDSLSFDMALEIVSQYQRRAILRTLIERDQSVISIEKIIDELIEVERRRGGSVPGEDYILSILVHVHGPKLEDAGLISYDVSDQEVDYHGNEKIERLLDEIRDIEGDW